MSALPQTADLDLDRQLTKEEYAAAEAAALAEMDADEQLAQRAQTGPWYHGGVPGLEVGDVSRRR